MIFFIGSRSDTSLVAWRICVVANFRIFNVHFLCLTTDRAIKWSPYFRSRLHYTTASLLYNTPFSFFLPPRRAAHRVN